MANGMNLMWTHQARIPVASGNTQHDTWFCSCGERRTVIRLAVRALSHFPQELESDFP